MLIPGPWRSCVTVKLEAKRATAKDLDEMTRVLEGSQDELMQEHKRIRRAALVKKRNGK